MLYLMHTVPSMENLYYGYYTKLKSTQKVPKTTKNAFFIKFVFRALSEDSGDVQIQKEYSSYIELINKMICQSFTMFTSIILPQIL